MANDEINARKLVERVLAGEERAFSEFFDGHFGRLYRLVLVRMNNDPDAAQEVVSAALTKAIRKLSSYKGEAGLFTWLCSIARNEMSDYFRSNSRHREQLVLIEDFDDIRAIVESMESPNADDPEESYRRVESTRLIQVALDALPPKYGDVLEWKYVYGYSVKEISDRLGLGREATQSILARAKRAFRESYSVLLERLTTSSKVVPS